MLRTLLVDGRTDDVVSFVTKLVTNNTELAVRAARADELATRNVELEKQLEKLLARVKKSETVSKAQLVLFLDALKRRPEVPASEGEAMDEYTALVAADDELRTASGIDEGEDDGVSKLRTPPPPRQPRSPTRRRTCDGSTIRLTCRPRSSPVRRAAAIANAWSRMSPR